MAAASEGGAGPPPGITLTNMMDGIQPLTLRDMERYCEPITDIIGESPRAVCADWRGRRAWFPKSQLRQDKAGHIYASDWIVEKKLEES